MGGGREVYSLDGRWKKIFDNPLRKYELGAKAKENPGHSSLKDLGVVKRSKMAKLFQIFQTEKKKKTSIHYPGSSKIEVFS